MYLPTGRHQQLYKTSDNVRRVKHPDTVTSMELSNNQFKYCVKKQPMIINREATTTNSESPLHPLYSHTEIISPSLLSREHYYFHPGGPHVTAQQLISL